MDVCHLMGLNWDSCQCVWGQWERGWVAVLLGAAGVSLRVPPILHPQQDVWLRSAEVPQASSPPVLFPVFIPHKAISSKIDENEGLSVSAGCEPPLDDVLSSWLADLDELLGSESRFTCSVAGVSLSFPYKDTLPKPSILNMRDASRMKMSWGEKITPWLEAGKSIYFCRWI